VTIARLEGGKDQPVATTVRKLADALGVDPEELMEPLPHSTMSKGLGPRPAAADLDRKSGSDAPPGLEDGYALSAHRVRVIDGPGVSRLLQQQPGLASLVSEAADQLVRLIPDIVLSLDLLTDPDYGEGEQLFLGVSTNLSEPEATEALRRFDREWWVHHAPRSRGLLCIDLSDA
jgi:transcriptional regulator with XRE-family HTH domain